MGLQINIDNGGTLTDICIIGETSVQKTKVLTTPYDLSRCLFDGLRKASGVVYGEPDVKRLLEEVDLIRYSTTQGTNAICERKGPRLGLILGKDGGDLAAALEAQDREVYSALVGDRVVTVDDAALLANDAGQVVVRAVNQLTAAGANRVVVSFGGKGSAGLENAFRRVALRKYPRHLLGAVPILYGSDLSSDPDVTRRTWTALLNSFLHPAMETFLFNAENRLRAFRTRNPLLIFRNDGDASRVAKTIALKTYSSGPRGGMEGVKTFAQRYGFDDVVSIDVGGTTTDVGQFRNGTVAEKRRGHVEGIGVSMPLCDIHSAGAGGSSIVKVVDGHITIGPESVGAVPGPACFGQGGKEATITDATLLSGVFDPASFFGGGMALDAERAAAAIQAHVAGPLGISVDGALLRMEQAFEKKVASELHRVTQISPGTLLLAFGGAGPLSACGIAEQAGVDSVAIPQMAAVFSAYGIGSCNVSQRYSVILEQRDDDAVASALAILTARAERDMFAEGVACGQYEVEARLVATQDGQPECIHDLGTSTHFPQALAAAPAVELEVRAVKSLRRDGGHKAQFNRRTPATASGVRTILHGDGSRREVPVYVLSRLKYGDHGAGPAILEEDYFTCRVLDHWTFVISDAGDILLNRNG